jgi:hypothetical protein
VKLSPSWVTVTQLLKIFPDSYGYPSFTRTHICAFCSSIKLFIRHCPFPCYIPVSSLPSWNNHLYNISWRSQDRSVDQTTAWRTEEFGFNSRKRQDIFLFSTASRLDLGPTQPPNQFWVSVIIMCSILFNSCGFHVNYLFWYVKILLLCSLIYRNAWFNSLVFVIMM